MATVSTWKYLYWSYLAKPAGDRTLYRLMKQAKPARIVELGIGSAERTVRLLGLVQKFAPGVELSYTGLDWFEERGPELEKLSLKAMHKRLHDTGAKCRIMPGGPTMAVPMLANALGGTQLLLVSQMASEELLAPVAFYLPRMTEGGTVILQEQATANGPLWRRVDLDQIAPQSAAPLRRAA